MLTERSLQAQFLIPMSVSLAFGILFATGITLILVPVLYAAGIELWHDLQERWQRRLISKPRGIEGLDNDKRTSGT